MSQSGPIVPSNECFVVRRPQNDPQFPVLVSIPHYGTCSPVGHDDANFLKTRYRHFPRGFADPFADTLYGDLHDAGALVLATRLSRLFVDVNRRRNDFSSLLL